MAAGAATVAMLLLRVPAHRLPPGRPDTGLAARVGRHRSLMRALVTGAAGFVGPVLVDHLTDAGDEVHGVDHAGGPDLLDGPGWIRLLADLRPDAVYHLAGWSDVGASWSDPVRTFRVNAEGTLHVLEAAAAADVARVLVISSADVYGSCTPDEMPLTEQRPPNPRSPYGASKVAAEVLARRAWGGAGLETVIARPFNHIGPGQGTQFVAPALARRIAQAEAGGGGTIRHGDLTSRRDLTDVRDVVRAYRALVEHGEAGEVYNVCSGRDLAMTEVLDHLVSQARAPVHAEVDPALLRPVDLPVLRGSYTRLHARTGWAPQIDITRTLTDVLDHARRNLAAEGRPTDPTSHQGSNTP
jgi:GDP-4-dehydro-6-deoxy-D-mannose reductase